MFIAYETTDAKGGTGWCVSEEEHTANTIFWCICIFQRIGHTNIIVHQAAIN